MPEGKKRGKGKAWAYNPEGESLFVFLRFDLRRPVKA